MKIYIKRLEYGINQYLNKEYKHIIDTLYILPVEVNYNIVMNYYKHDYMKDYNKFIKSCTNAYGMFDFVEYCKMLSKNKDRNNFIVEHVINLVKQGKKIILGSNFRYHLIELKNMLNNKNINSLILNESSIGKYYFGNNSVILTLVTYSFGDVGVGDMLYKNRNTIIMCTPGRRFDSALCQLHRECSKNNEDGIIIYIDDINPESGKRSDPVNPVKYTSYDNIIYEN
jgi:hypothetical protein